MYMETGWLVDKADTRTLLEGSQGCMADTRALLEDSQGCLADTRALLEDSQGCLADTRALFEDSQGCLGTGKVFTYTFSMVGPSERLREEEYLLRW